MSAREWSESECKDAYAEAVSWPGTISVSIGRAILTLRAERDEARAEVERMRAAIRYAKNELPCSDSLDCNDTTHDPEYCHIGIVDRITAEGK